MDTDNKNEEQFDSSSFESLDILIKRMKDGTFSEILDDWKWILSYSVKYKWVILFYLMLGVFTTSLGLVSSVVSKYLIDIITGYQTDKLVFLIILMVASAVFGMVFNSLISRITTKLNININNDIQADIFDKIIKSDWMEINKYSNGDIINRFNSDVSTVSGNAINWIPTIIISIYRFIATFIVIFHYDKIMALIAFMGAPFILAASRLLISRQRYYGKKVREMSSEMMSFEIETFYNIDTIKSFDISEYYSGRLRWWQKKWKDISLKYNMFSIKSGIFTGSVATLIQFLAFAYCLFRLWNHDISYGTMTLFLQQRSGLTSSFNQVISIIPGFLNSSISAHRIRELVELPKEIRIEESRELDEDIKSGFTIEMKNAAFCYKVNNNIIADSDFKASSGEIIGLIGPSGGGKTTMIRLILGLVRPTEGEIYIKSNGRKVAMNASLRHLFSYVPQGNTMLLGTIAENMRVVKEDATDEEIIEALKTACAWDFVSKLPDTIYTKLGERGRGFSEGQAQRLAIARALLLDAPILLLDEATSALDVTTEGRVLKNIITECPGRTCIVTTHRPSVLSMCDRVYCIMDGKVSESSEAESGKMLMDFD